MSADPNDARAAFAEYAADRLWVASHLTQLAGVALVTAALVFLARRLEERVASGWERIAAAGAIASLAVAGALQAVDGIALKAMVDAWARAGAGEKDAAFRAAFAVREVEVGLASMLGLFLGATATLYGIALLADRTAPRWLGALAIAGGVPTFAGGVATAASGFSDTAMALSMPSGLLLMAWMVAVGVALWRDPDRGAPPDPAHPAHPARPAA